MAETQIQKVSHKHEAIVRWLVENPEEPLHKCAKEFGVQRAWLSVIIHSDVFQERLREAHGEVFSETTLKLREKLSGVAHRAVDKLAEKVEDTQDGNYLLKVADTAMKHLAGPSTNGVGEAAVGNTQNNFYLVDQGALKEARERMAAVRGGGEKVIPGEVVDGSLSSAE